MHTLPTFYCYFVSPDPCHKRQACLLLRASDKETPAECFKQDGSFLVKFCLPSILVEGTADVTFVPGKKKSDRAFNLPCSENSVLRWRFISRRRSDRSWYYIVPYNTDLATAIGNTLLMVDEKEFREEYCGFRGEFRRLI